MNITLDMNDGTATFKIDEVGTSHGETFRGVFKVKCILSPLEFVDADALYRDLLGKTNPTLASEWTGRIAFHLAQLKYRVVKAPNFWTPENNERGLGGSEIDDNILSKVFDLAFAAEVQYREAIKKKFDKSSEALKKSVDNGSISPEEQEEDTKPKEELENDIDQ